MGKAVAAECPDQVRHDRKVFRRIRVGPAGDRIGTEGKRDDINDDRLVIRTSRPYGWSIHRHLLLPFGCADPSELRLSHSDRRPSLHRIPTCIAVGDPAAVPQCGSFPFRNAFSPPDCYLLRTFYRRLAPGPVS
jgi:hypothetical protein